VTDADHALPVPAGIGDWDRAAALCETFFTVWTQCSSFAPVACPRGEKFLVHGASSGSAPIADPGCKPMRGAPRFFALPQGSAE